MKDLSVRKMSKADLPVITRIESDCQSHPWTLLQFLDGFNAGHKGWVFCREVENRELILGFAIVASVLDEQTLLNICVRPEFQRQGIGRAILDRIIEQAKTENMLKMFLEVRISNSSAIKLYESAGFKKISERRDYYPAIIGREDGLVYLLAFHELT